MNNSILLPTNFHLSPNQGVVGFNMNQPFLSFSVSQED